MTVVPPLPPHHAPFAAHYVASGYWLAGRAPDRLAAVAAEAPERTALIDRKGPLSYGALDRLVRRFACALLAQGVGPGDRIAIQLPNWREFAIAQQAAIRIGAAYVPLLPQLRDAEVEFALREADARVLVAPSTFKGFDHAAMAGRMPVPHRYIVDGSFDAALAHPWEETHAAALNAITVDADALRVILFTSGTESKPKGVLHSYNSLYFGMKRHVDYFGLGADEVVMCASPVGHGTGAVNGVEFAIHLGATVVLIDNWNPVDGLAAITRHAATMMWGATTFYSDLVSAAAAPDAPRPDRFRLAFTAGAPVPRDLAEAVSRRLGAQLISAYGQSEGQNITITRLGDPLDRLTGSDGRFHDGIEWKLVDAERRPVPEGAEGEIAYRGPNLCLGYLDPAHQAHAFDAEGFIHSGDIGTVDADGYLRIVGRRKEIIIRGGENISPAEIENILFSHPQVERIAVVGYPDPRLGERACAVVQPRGDAPTLEGLLDHMRQRGIAKFKFPERLLIVDALPLTPSGKVRKDVLKARIIEAQP